MSVATFEILRSRRIEPLALLGHSYGELTALTCAGAFSVADAVRILHEVDRCVTWFGPVDSGMLSVAADPATVCCLLATVDDSRLAIACYNAPQRTVVCGPNESLNKIAAMARERDVICIPLPLPYAFHGPLVAAALERAQRALADVRQRPLRAAVFSATAGRYYRDSDQLVRRLVEGLHRPVRFFGAVARLHAEGADGFVECAPQGLLAKLIPQCLPGVASAAIFDFLTTYRSRCAHSVSGSTAT
jgi:acyl transferase domain-containing protein